MSDTNLKQADTEVNKLYSTMRNRYGDINPKANGYRLKKYFIKEQEMILSEISDENKIIVDLACGSGLMLNPLISTEQLIIGIDFNETACLDAKRNKLNIIRGDVFSIPIADSSVDKIINCQFLNQQSNDKAEHLLDEIYRILKPGGRLIMIWRNDRALIHKLAIFIYRYIDKFTGRPEFPYYDNYVGDLAHYSTKIGFSIVSQFLTFPLFNWNFHNLDSIGAKALGASCFLVVEK
ncbi:MAG: methyltransferase domain-containing protein [Gammaproteobacteria bacterium]